MENTKYSKVYRIIHWAIALAFALLLITIFLRLTWLNKYNVAAIIQDYLKGTEQTLSKDQAIALAKKIRQPMWNWHIYMGYVLAILFSIRFILPAFGQMKIQNPNSSWIYLMSVPFSIIELVDESTKSFIPIYPVGLFHDITNKFRKYTPLHF